jgi:putative ABC transport system permease protein
MGAWINDLRLAMRALAKRPGFSLTVLITLSAGVGAFTALFGVFRGVFMEPIPLPESDELVLVMEMGTFGCCGPASGPDFVDWRERNRVFEGIAALEPGTFTLTGLEEPERVYGTYVTAGAFGFLGVEPLMGRAFVPEDQDAAQVVLLSHELWLSAMGGDTDVLGRTLEVDGVVRTVVGVMPEEFDVPSPWARTTNHRLFLPFDNENLAGPRGSHSYPVVARLASGVTKEAAQEDMDRVLRELAAEYPDSHATRTARVFTVHEYLYGDVGRTLGLILGAAGLVLLIACGNVAGLQLARAAGRESELAVRAALGASRRAVVRLLFSESLVLAALGAVGGILASTVLIRGFRAMLPPGMPRVDGVQIDGTALMVALAASAFTALVFGMAPALLSARANLAASVKEGGHGTLAPGKERARDLFIVGQIALGLVLANGSALLIRSYTTLRGEEQGFVSENVITMALNPAGPRYEDDAAVARFYDQVVTGAGSLPGVTAVGTVSRLPLRGGTNGNVVIEGQAPLASTDPGMLAEVTSVTGDYFRTLGIPVRRGRTLLPEDSSSAAVGAVVNATFADKAWPGEDPLGRRFSFGDDPPHWITVVGVVGDVRQWGPERPALAQVYFPLVQGWTASGYLVARVTGDATTATADLRRAILTVDPTQPPSDVQMMSDRVERSYAQRRFYTTLIGLFAAAALLLAGAGIYGTVSYFVARRMRDLGIRIALGARSAGILRLVVKRAVRLAVLGIAAGLLGVWASTALVRGLVYGIEPTDLPTLVVGCITLAAVSVGAATLPASRATRVSPVMALRSE